MLPQEGSIDDTVEGAPTISQRIFYGGPVVAGSLVGALGLGYLAYNYVKNITYNAVGNIYSSIAGGAAAAFFGVTGYALGMIAVAGVMGLVSKGARKHLGIPKFGAKEAKAKGPPG